MFRLEETAKLDHVCATFFLGRGLQGSGLGLGSGSWSSMEKRWGWSPRAQINILNQIDRDGQLWRAWVESLQQCNCSQGPQHEQSQGTEKQEEAGTQEGLWGTGTSIRPVILFLGGEGAGRLTLHSKSNFPSQDWSLKRRQDGREARSWCQSHGLELAGQDQVHTRPSSRWDGRGRGNASAWTGSPFLFCLRDGIK